MKHPCLCVHWGSFVLIVRKLLPHVLPLQNSVVHSFKHVLLFPWLSASSYVCICSSLVKCDLDTMMECSCPECKMYLWLFWQLGVVCEDDYVFAPCGCSFDCQLDCEEFSVYCCCFPSWCFDRGDLVAVNPACCNGHHLLAS